MRKWEVFDCGFRISDCGLKGLYGSGYGRVKAEGRGQRAEGRGQRTEGVEQRAEGMEQRAEGGRQRIEFRLRISGCGLKGLYKSGFGRQKTEDR